MRLSFKNKHAIVCGSTDGIGMSTASLLADLGCGITLVARDKEKLENVRSSLFEDLGQVHYSICADFNDPNSLKDKVNSHISELGKGIDILVNNAALRPGTPFVDMEYSDWKKVTGIDLDGAFLCSKLCVPGMISNSWGRIINIAGLMALEGHEGYTHVSASKMGLVGFTRSLAKELAPHNILVNCVSPGTIDTTGPRHAKMTKEELDELAAQICACMITEHRDYGELASRLAISNHHKKTSPSFSEVIEQLRCSKNSKESLLSV